MSLPSRDAAIEVDFAVLPHALRRMVRQRQCRTRRCAALDCWSRHLRNGSVCLARVDAEALVERCGQRRGSISRPRKRRRSARWYRC